MRIPFVAFLLAAALTALLTPFVRTLAVKYGAVAVPRERDVHKAPLPRWGGLAMVGAFLITLGLVYAYIAYARLVFPWPVGQLRQFEGVLLGAILVAIVGAIDDKYDISALWQTTALVTSGLILIVFGVRIEGVTNPFYTPSPTLTGYDPHSFFAFPLWLSYLSTIVWVFLVAKTVDFIDGLDGLAAGVCAICGLTLALMSAMNRPPQYEVTIIAAALVGVCLGFLRDNAHPAKIIMGTVGAQFLGFVLAAIAMIGTFKIAATLSVALPILALGLPIFDGLRVVATRILNKTPAYLPDKATHIHHLLLKHGLSQTRAVWVIYGLTAGLCVIALLIFHYTGR